MGLVDLHTHSVYSDGTLTPAELLNRAQENGVSLFSITDHDLVEGTLEGARLAQKMDLRFVPGVEVDTFCKGMDFHVLCYGADFADAPLLELIRDSRRRIDQMSVDLLLAMQKEYPSLDLEEYEELAHDPHLGGWKMLNYLRLKGITKDLREGMRFYPKYGVTYADAGFFSMQEAIARMHAAGGTAILAHPGETVREGLSEILPDLLDLGLDGVECFYPKHTPEVQTLCLEICRRRGLMITAGSDCHGAFGSADVGATQTEECAISFPWRS